LSDLSNLEFLSTDFRKIFKYQIYSAWRDGRTEGQTDMTKLSRFPLFCERDLNLHSVFQRETSRFTVHCCSEFAV